MRPVSGLTEAQIPKIVAFVESLKRKP